VDNPADGAHTVLRGPRRAGQTNADRR